MLLPLVQVLGRCGVCCRSTAGNSKQQSATASLRPIRTPTRLLGRTRTELAGAMTWLAWYASGTFQAVMDYMDTVNGEPLPGRM